MAQPDQRQLMVMAREKAEALVGAMRKDQTSLAAGSEGHTAFAVAIDAGCSTLDNLETALQVAPSSSMPD